MASTKKTKKIAKKAAVAKKATKTLKKNPVKKATKKLVAKAAPIKTPKLRKAAATTHMVVFEYTGGVSGALDQAACVVLGRHSSGSGFDFDNRRRDVDWDYVSRLAADKAAERLQKWWAKEKKQHKGVTASIRVASY